VSALFGNQIRDIMYRDVSLINHQTDEDLHSHREIVEKQICLGFTVISVVFGLAARREAGC
ncbi:hypothetical protein ACNIUU_27015, partial [Escherichia coli]